MRSLLCDVVRELELQVAEAIEGNEVIQQIRDLEPHVLLSDLLIPGGGFDYVRTIRALYPSCPIILLAELGDHDAKAEAFADLQQAIIGILDGDWEPGA